MCMCLHATGKNNVNGQPGYSWNDGRLSTRPVDPPAVGEGDTIVYDEPGRCGDGTDSHCHHYRLVRHDQGSDLFKPDPRYAILVRHGGGDERVDLPRHDPGMKRLILALEAMDSDGRYWTLNTLRRISSDSADAARQEERTRWATAAAEKRIKLKIRKGRVTVDIEPREPAAVTA